MKAIGEKRAQGWGEIDRIDVEAVEADERFGLMTADGPARPRRAVAALARDRRAGGRDDDHGEDRLSPLGGGGGILRGADRRSGRA